MKKMKWLGLAAAAALATSCAAPPTAQPPVVVQTPPPPPQPSRPALSPPATEVVRLAEAGTSEDVILAYIQNDSAPFNLSADQILYLKDQGISPTVVTAMLNRDNALRAEAQNATPPPPPPPPPTPVTAPATPPPEYVSAPPTDVTYFYNDLAPYGTWVQLDGVGWCWQPRVVVMNRAWRPYCDSGHWVWTDAGWFWQSDYSWGWAPFHYGRWHLHDRCGWVWLPDRVWGPSWVVWRTSGEHCGWAPLPPRAEFTVAFGWRFNGVHVAADFDFGLHPDHFTFVAFHDFTRHDLGYCREQPTQVTRIYNNTTIINNYVVNNTTIINQGVKVEHVAAATHTEIRRVPIHEAPAGSKPMTPAGGVRVETAVYRSQPKPPPTKPAVMVAQKIDEQHPVIQHTPPPVKPGATAATGAAAANHSKPKPVAAGATAPVAAPQTKPAPGPMAQAPSKPLQTQPQHNASASQAGTVYRPDQPGQLHPLTTHEQFPGNAPAKPAEKGTPPGQASHVYQPKTYHQASERHALPPLYPNSSVPYNAPAKTPPGQEKKAEKD